MQQSVFKKVGRISLLLASALLVSTSANGTEVKEYTLNNGMQILVKEDHRAPVAIMQLWYKVGSAYEQSGTTGISHALEHMMFKGTKNHPAGEYEQLIASKGGQHNAFTSRDFTEYYVKIAAKELPLVLQLEADRMRGALLTTDDFAKERKVIIEERLLRVEDQPVAMVEERFNLAAFAANGYQQPIIGWMGDIEALTVEDLQRWYDAWYTPGNAVLTIVGDVKADEVYSIVKQNFGGIPGEVAAKVKPRKTVAKLGARKTEVKRAAKVPHLFMGYNVPSVNTAENAWEPYALEVIAYVLAGSDSARFSKQLIRGSNIAVKVDAGYSPYDMHDTLLTFDGMPAQNKTLATLEQAILAEVQTLQTETLNAEELQRVKTQIRADKAYAMDSMFYKAYELGKLVVSGYDWRETDNYLKQIQAISAQQLQLAAQKFLTSDNLAIAYLTPTNLDSKIN